MNRRITIWLGVLVTLLAIIGAWSYGQLAEARRAGAAAAGDLEACRSLAGHIRRYRQQPARAAEFERASTETTAPIEQAAREAELRDGQLERITPKPPRRLGDSVYKEKPTEVQLRDVSLKQVYDLLSRLTAPQVGLSVRSIRLTAPRPEDTEDRWNCEVELTYLIFDPPQNRP